MLILDLSNNNSEPDWKQLVQQGVTGVFLKASEGTSFTDSTFKERRVAANKVGLHVGAYHFARPDQSGAAMQAALFTDIVGKLDSTDLKPVLDFESASSLSPSELEKWARDFNQEVKAKLGRVPIFYSYSAYVEMLRPSWPIGNGLWLASYGRDDGTEHPFVVPFPWKKIVAHQFTSNCSITGCAHPVDMSNANSLRSLLAYPVRVAAKKLVPKRKKK